MQFAAPHQPSRDVGRLQRSRVRSVNGPRDSGSPQRGCAGPRQYRPNEKLPDAGLQHLIGMEAGVFAQHRKRSVAINASADGRAGIAATSLAARSICRCRSKASSKRRESSPHRPEGRRVARFFAWNAGRRHVEIARKVESHRSVQSPAWPRDITVDVRRSRSA